MAIEIVDFPIENGDFPVRYVSLPEGSKTHSGRLFVLRTDAAQIGQWDNLWQPATRTEI